MGNSIKEQATAVKCGYWPLYRYNPLGNNGNGLLSLDYNKPDGLLNTFLDVEDRYASLMSVLPKEAEILRAGLAKEGDKVYSAL